MKRDTPSLAEYQVQFSGPSQDTETTTVEDDVFYHEVTAQSHSNAHPFHPCIIQLTISVNYIHLTHLHTPNFIDALTSDPVFLNPSCS
jgi:hypothetical protein